jgi:predicted transcriptional regulator
MLLSDWRAEVAGVSSRVPVLLVEMLASNPFLTVKRAAQNLNVAFTTVQRAVEKLEKLSIVTEVSKAKRDRVYCAKAILDILEEPAKISPSEKK